MCHCFRLDASFHSSYATLSGRIKAAPANMTMDGAPASSSSTGSAIGRQDKASKGSTSKDATSALRPEPIKEVSMALATNANLSAGLKVASMYGYVNMDDERK